MIIGKSLTALGGGGLKPEITVTAKAGALLNLHFKDSAIILQSYQFGASETKHTFVVDVSETAYVVEDATNGASAEVLVDAVAQYSVEIEYVLWLYKDGDNRANLTAFDAYYHAVSMPTVVTTLEDDYVLVRQNQVNCEDGVCTPEIFSTAGYSKLCVEWSKTSDVNSNYSNLSVAMMNKQWSGLMPGTSSSGTHPWPSSRISELGSTRDYYNDYSDTKHITEFDISGNTVSGYLAVYFYYVAEAKIYKIWLE